MNNGVIARWKMKQPTVSRVPTVKEINNTVSLRDAEGIHIKIARSLMHFLERVVERKG